MNNNSPLQYSPLSFWEVPPILNISFISEVKKLLLAEIIFRQAERSGATHGVNQRRWMRGHKQLNLIACNNIFQQK